MNYEKAKTFTIDNKGFSDQKGSWYTKIEIES